MYGVTASSRQVAAYTKRHAPDKDPQLHLVTAVVQPCLTTRCTQQTVHTICTQVDTWDPTDLQGLLQKNRLLQQR